MKSITPIVRSMLIKAQRSEITEYHIYKKLAQKTTNEKSKKILNSIAEDELRHYNIWMKYSGRKVEPSRWNIFKFYWMAQLFGVSFGLKQMELGEQRAQIDYQEIGKEIPEALIIGKEENQHEKELLKMLKSKD